LSTEPGGQDFEAIPVPADFGRLHGSHTPAVSQDRPDGDQFGLGPIPTTCTACGAASGSDLGDAACIGLEAAAHGGLETHALTILKCAWMSHHPKMWAVSVDPRTEEPRP
jgi:hypothetical protein